MINSFLLLLVRSVSSVKSTEKITKARVSSYNAIQRGLVLKMILSHSKTYFDEKKIDTPSENIATQEKIIELNIEQKRASEKILKISSRRDYNTILLDGVPGSGKTEVYFSTLKNYLTEKEDNESKMSASTFVRKDKKIGRNDPCPCGSGKAKFNSL